MTPATIRFETTSSDAAVLTLTKSSDSSEDNNNRKIIIQPSDSLGNNVNASASYDSAEKTLTVLIRNGVVTMDNLEAAINGLTSTSNITASHALDGTLNIPAVVLESTAVFSGGVTGLRLLLFC